MIFSISPPIVSRPSESGITSSSSHSSLRSRLPASLLACTAAPSATTSSGLRLVSGGWPKNSATARRTCGMRVAPPTSTTPLISAGARDRVAQCPLDGLQRLGDEVRGDLAKDRLRQRQVDRQSIGQRRLHHRGIVIGQVLLGFARLDQQQPRIGGRQWRHLGRLDDPAEHAMIEVIAAKRRIAIGGQHFEHALGQAQDRDVERSAAKVVYRVDTFGGIVEAVGDRRRGRLVQQPQDRQAGKLRGILGGLALRVVEIGRHGHHRAVDGPAERVLSARSRNARSRSAEISTGSSRQRGWRCAPCRAPRRSDREIGDRSARSARPRPIRRFTDTMVFCGSDDWCSIAS